MIYVGTCGFSYKDWIGSFYPPRTRVADMLAYYAQRFAAVEIDSSYYGVPQPRTVASMAARTPPAFRCSFKLPQTVTHPPDPSSLQRVHADAAALLESIAPMASADKLACVLAQFPNAFRPGSGSEDYVRRVVDAFAGVPVVVEFRNRRWQRPETLDLLRALGAGYGNVDLPHLEGLPTPSSDATGGIGYVRFHGRNAATWWRGSASTRYDYAYCADELIAWTDRIAEVEAQSRDTYVFFNNHANARAPHNAEAILSLLEDRYGTRAADCIARAPFADRGGTVRQTALPGMLGP